MIQKTTRTIGIEKLKNSKTVGSVVVPNLQFLCFSIIVIVNVIPGNKHKHKLVSSAENVPIYDLHSLTQTVTIVCLHAGMRV